MQSKSILLLMRVIHTKTINKSSKCYKYQGKTYRYVVNGRTGQVYGERPWSWIKIAFAVLVAAAIAGAVGYFAGLEQAG